ncbi:MAG: hypothetical protein RJA36_209 [Pseudomonadota bacterium]
MNSRHIALLLATTLASVTPAYPEDIDLYINPGVSSNSLPNVLFVIDNTANWNTAFANEKAALTAIFNSLPTYSDGSARFNVGLLMMNESGSDDTNIQGGYVRAALRPMTGDNKAIYAAMINALDNQKDKGNAGVSGLAMAEAYLYYSGGTPYAGNGKVKADFRTNDTSGWAGTYSTADIRSSMQAVYNRSGNVLSSKSATTYIPPNTSNCLNNYIIYLSNGPAQDSNASSTQASSLLSTAGGDTSQIPVSPSGSQSNLSDEWARFMKLSPYGISTFTIDVNPSSSGQGPGWTALLKSMASVSGGVYYKASSANNAGADIQTAINAALAEIQNKASVFASVSLPASTNTQGQYLNQLFVGMFRPDADDRPRWAGNLKQYKLGYVNGSSVLQTLDADDSAAIDPNSGFVGICARSYWTPTTPDSYWTFQPMGACPAPSGQPINYYKNSNYPDGDVVEKGGSAHMVRSLSPASRSTVYTCSTNFSTCASTSTLSSLASFNTANYASLGASSSSEAASLLNWVLGKDILDENTTDGVLPSGTTTLSSTVIRPSVQGDVIHSRPQAVNFGTTASPNVLVFYGSNDGLLRAINGNREAGATIGGKAPGNELWSFAPPEAYLLFNRSYKNDTPVYTPTITTGSPKIYGMDGPLKTYTKSDGKTWLFAGMRRGGRVLYAFDVSNPDSLTPSLLWKIGCPNNLPYINASGTALPTNSSGAAVTTLAQADTGCPATWTSMGQTWSAPVPVLAGGFSSGTAPLVVMGGGYDTCEDADPNTCATASLKGNHIFVLDSSNGNAKKDFPTDRPVAGDVFPVLDGNGMVSWIYATDLGGNVYRISGATANAAIGNTPPENWTITKIASLGCNSTSTCTANRKFFFGPDIVQNSDGSYSLIVGSGDREKPVNSYTSAYNVTDYFFVIKDKPTTTTWLSAESARCGGNSVICLASLGQLTSTDQGVTGTPTDKGWYLGLAVHESVVTSALTIYGTATFSTHVPVPVGGATTCSSTLGVANVYNLNYQTGASMNGTPRPFQAVTGGGLPPSPVGGMVTLDNGKQVAFIVGANPTSPLSGGSPPAPTSSTQPKRRVFWYLQQ